MQGGNSVLTERRRNRCESHTVTKHQQFFQQQSINLSSACDRWGVAVGGWLPAACLSQGLTDLNAGVYFVFTDAKTKLIHFALQGIFSLSVSKWCPPPHHSHHPSFMFAFNCCRQKNPKKNNLSNFRNLLTWLRPLNPTCTISLDFYRLLWTSPFHYCVHLNDLGRTIKAVTGNLWQ